MRTFTIRAYQADWEAAATAAIAQRQPIGAGVAALLARAAEAQQPPQPLGANLGPTIERQIRITDTALALIQAWRERHGLTWPQALHAATTIL